MSTFFFGLIGILFVVDYTINNNIVSESVLLLGQLIALILTVMFLMAGVSKIMAINQMQKSFIFFNYPMWFLRLTGVLELIGSIILVIGFFETNFYVFGGFYLAGIMVGAIGSHVLRVADNRWMPALFLFSMSGYVFLINFLTFL